MRPICNRVKDFHALGDLSKDGVMPVKPGGLVECDEELAAVCVRAAVCHREDSASDMAEVFVEFVVNLVSRTSGAWRAVGALPGVGAATLRHESGNHPMEGHAAVESAFREGDDVRDRVRAFVLVEFDIDVALAGHDSENGICLLGFHLGGFLLGIGDCDKGQQTDQCEKTCHCRSLAGGLKLGNNGKWRKKLLGGGA